MNNNTNNPNNAVVVDKCTQRLNALKADVPPNAVIPIDGVNHSVAEVIAIYQGCLDSRSALVNKRSEVKAAMATREQAEAKRRAADTALKPFVINTFGNGSKQALDFGFPPKKKASVSPKKKADAVAKGKATREARHTMGPKQKLKIQGTIPVQPAPAAPATTNGAAPHA